MADRADAESKRKCSGKIKPRKEADNSNKEFKKGNSSIKNGSEEDDNFSNEAKKKRKSQIKNLREEADNFSKEAEKKRKSSVKSPGKEAEGAPRSSKKRYRKFISVNELQRTGKSRVRKVEIKAKETTKSSSKKSRENRKEEIKKITGTQKILTVGDENLKVPVNKARPTTSILRPRAKPQIDYSNPSPANPVAAGIKRSPPHPSIRRCLRFPAPKSRKER